MKVFALVGSSRKDGKTAVAVKEQLELLDVEEKDITYMNVKDLDVHYCIGCGYCRNVEACAQKDDMELVLKHLHEADLYVIGSPIYYGGLSAQLKTICDRLHPAYRGKGVSTLAGKKLIMVFTQDSTKDAYADFHEVNNKYLFKFMGIDIIKTIVVGNDGKKIIDHQTV